MLLSVGDQGGNQPKKIKEKAVIMVVMATMVLHRLLMIMTPALTHPATLWIPR
jgi:hypothetical protein